MTEKNDRGRPMGDANRFFKRFNLFRTLAVGPDPRAFEWCMGREGSQCEALDYESAASARFERPPHLVLFHYVEEESVREFRDAAMGNVASLHPWQLVLFAPKEAMEGAVRYALRHHAFGLYPLPEGEEAAAKALVAVLPPMLERLQEHGRLTQLQRVADLAPAEVLAAEGKPTFLNREAKALFGVKEPKELEPLWRELSLPEENGDDALPLEWNEKRFLLHRSPAAPGSERLHTFVPLPENFGDERHRFLSRVEFIDRLKDRMAQRSEETKLTIIMGRIDNFDAVTQAAGWLEANAILKRFIEEAQKLFDPVDAVGIWHKNMPIALFDGPEPEELKRRLKRFVAEMKLFDFGANVTLSVEFTLVEVANDDLNGLITLIEKEYEGELSVRETKAFPLYKTGSNEARPDEGQLLRQFFTNIMANGLPVKLMNLYKGLPISSPTKILKMEEEKIVVTAEKLQKYVMETERKVVFQSPHLPGDVEAEVHLIDPRRPLAIVKNPKMLHTSINNRKHTRVAVTSRLPIALKEGKRQYTGYIYDLSVNSIALRFNAGKFAENELKGKEVRAAFRLPWENEEGFVNIETEAKVLFNRDEGEHHKVVLILEPDDVIESYLFDYIYKRQKELIQEIKNRIG